MAFIDLYQSLTDEQLAQLRALKSPEDVRAFMKAEEDSFTEEQKEALCGLSCFANIGKQRNVIETGLYGRYILPSEEWLELVLEARKGEEAVRLRFPSAAEQEAAICRLIAGKNQTLRKALMSAENTETFLEDCITLRGPLHEGRQRRIVRELARLQGYLADKAPIPDSAEDLLSLWETANNREPIWADDLPARFRTADDRIPFAHEKNPFEPAPPPPGFHTAPPEEIPDAVSRLLEWIQRRDLSRELLAVSSHFLLVRIHPFPDGNGHTARLLCCGLLAADYSAITLTAFTNLLNKNRRCVFDAARVIEFLEGDLHAGCCSLLRILIRGQKQLLDMD